jgi:hypothetical protein
LWASHLEMVDILKPEVDSSGYDIVVSYKSIIRHVQLKASLVNGSTVNQNINASLATQQSGCIIWILIDDALTFKGYLWFGGEPGKPLPDISKLKQARHIRGNAQGVKPERPNTKTMPKSSFEHIDDIGTIVERLFGKYGA